MKGLLARLLLGATGLSPLIWLAVAGVLSAALYGGYAMWHHSIWKEATAAQAALDEKIITAANQTIGELRESRKEVADQLELCGSKVTTQNDGVKKWQDQAKTNEEAARKALSQLAVEKAQREAERAKHGQDIRTLQALAAAAPKLQSCTDELSQTDKIMRDGARERRALGLK